MHVRYALFLLAMFTVIAPHNVLADVQVGNITIKDDGSIVFPDNSSQATATLQGPQGIQGPEGPAGISPWTTNGNDINYTTGKVGVGVTSPSSALDVNGSVKVGTDTDSCITAKQG